MAFIEAFTFIAFMTALNLIGFILALAFITFMTEPFAGSAGATVQLSYRGHPAKIQSQILSYPSFAFTFFMAEPLAGSAAALAFITFIGCAAWNAVVGVEETSCEP
jgi:hypothetical protein